MAKKKLLADKLRTPRTTKKPIDLDAVELVDKKEPEVKPEPPKPQAKAKTTVKKKKKAEPIVVEEEQEMHRTSFNFPFEVYEAMRLHTFKTRTTMTDYLITLIKKDLKIK